jgi:heterodisulfide reductase subunit A
MIGNGKEEKFRTLIISTGFRLFDASLKEEYGYGLYPYVVTSAELENRLREGDSALQVGGKQPGKVAFVHCVGSRDAKSGNLWCSRVCCITGVKQAMAVKKLYPSCEVFNFYMDLRMFGVGYEELYQQAQEQYHIQFIRGRVSEAAPAHSGAIQVKAEDTLLGAPLKLEVDWLVLLIGMEPAAETVRLAGGLALRQDTSGFLKGQESMLRPWTTAEPGVFIAGACCGPASVPESITQGRAAAASVVKYLSRHA